jgi:methionyl-tRNA formyltransferase
LTHAQDAATPKLRVGFAGTPEFARAALLAIAQAGYRIPLVLSQPDRPAGRGMKLQASPVAALARERGWPLAQPTGLRLNGRYAAEAQAAQLQLQAAALDVLVVAAYGLILPPWVLEVPRLGCLNIHGSLLPRWRGAAPIQRAIEAGDSETGITIMQMDAGLDTGPMLLSEALPIGPGTTTAALHDALATLGARLIVATLHEAEHGRLNPQPQPLQGVSYAHKIDKAEAPLDWQQGAPVLERRIRAFDPFPGCTVQLGQESLKVWRARALPADETSTTALPGTVLRADPQACHVACAEGRLELLELQRPGSKRSAAAQVLPALLAQGRLKLGQVLPTTPPCPVAPPLRPELAAAVCRLGRVRRLGHRISLGPGRQTRSRGQGRGRRLPPRGALDRRLFCAKPPRRTRRRVRRVERNERLHARKQDGAHARHGRSGRCQRSQRWHRGRQGQSQALRLA